MKSNTIQKNKGFTIIETLVAITILMIAIAGPLTIASKGLNAATYAHDQSIATYLAQDGMEYVKNVKNSNKINNRVDWLTGLSSCNISVPAKCSIDTVNGDPAIPSGIVNCSAPCSLYLYLKNDDTGYSPDSINATKTQFSREFFITTISADEVTATVRVYWQNGTISNEVKLNSQLFNVLK